MGDVKGLGVSIDIGDGDHTLIRPGLGVVGSNVYSQGFLVTQGCSSESSADCFCDRPSNRDIGHLLVSTKATSGSGRLVPRSKYPSAPSLFEAGFATKLASKSQCT